jgi:hypothetical protein
MDKIQDKIEYVKELLEKALKLVSPPKISGLPSPKAIGVPNSNSSLQPKKPSIAPAAKKNPVDVAQQIKDPSIKKLAVNQAKEFVKTDKNGQWYIETV